jgi:hypothetical protein
MSPLFEYLFLSSHSTVDLHHIIFNNPLKLSFFTSNLSLPSSIRSYDIPDVVHKYFTSVSGMQITSISLQNLMKSRWFYDKFAEFSGK